MNELIDKLKSKAGLTDEQAVKSLEAIKDFVKEKFPMLGGAVDNIFKSDTPFSGSPDPLEDLAASIEPEKSSWLDKISDVIPGEMGEKIESFAKKSATGAEGAFEMAKDVAEDAFEKAKDAAEDLAEKAKDLADDVAAKARVKYDSFSKKEDKV